MFVVRKVFRNYGNVVPVGSIVEPTGIKWFKTRLKDRYIVEVNAHNFEMWREYFKGKFNIELKMPEAVDNIALPEVSEEPTDSADVTSNTENTEQLDGPKATPVVAKVVATVTER